MNKTQYVAALRDLADFVEAKDFPDTWKGYLSWNTDYSFDEPKLFFYVESKTDFGKITSAMGSYEKHATPSYTSAKKILPAGALIEVTGDRSKICKKIVLGTRKLAAEPEQIIPAKPEREEEIVEWECPESFNALKDEVESDEAIVTR